MEVAASICDEKWESYTSQELEAARRNLESGQEAEPVQAVFQSFLSLSISEDEQIQDRVQLGEITSDYDKKFPDEHMSSQQVSIILQDLEFVKKNLGGNVWIYAGDLNKLAAAAKRLNVDDELFEAETDSQV